MQFEEKEERGLPHSDAKQNLLYYERMIAKVIFDKDIKVEMQKYKGDLTCILFVHGPSPRGFGELGPDDEGDIARRKGAYCISLHQPHRVFREELCGIINSMGINGMLKRIGIPKKTPTEWQKLFGE